MTWSALSLNRCHDVAVLPAGTGLAAALASRCAGRTPPAGVRGCRARHAAQRAKSADPGPVKGGGRGQHDLPRVGLPLFTRRAGLGTIAYTTPAGKGRWLGFRARQR
jgi:hypothetical protein